MYLQINGRDGTMNSQFGGGSFGTSSSDMRGTGAVDFSTVYSTLHRIYTTVHIKCYHIHAQGSKQLVKIVQTLCKYKQADTPSIILLMARLVLCKKETEKFCNWLYYYGYNSQE